MSLERSFDQRALGAFEVEVAGARRRLRPGARRVEIGALVTIAPAQQHGSLHCLTKAADIIAPLMRRDPRRGIVSDRQRRSPITRGETIEEMPRQPQRLAIAPRERRHDQFHSIKPEQQIGIQRVAKRHPIKPAGRDRPDVIEQTGKDRLKAPRHRLHIVDHQRCAPCRRNRCLQGARILRRCGWQQMHRRGGAARSAMDGARDEALARSRRPDHQHRRIGRRDTRDRLAQAGDRRIFTEDQAIFVGSLRPRPYGHLGATKRHCALQCGDQLVVVPGLDDEIARPRAHRLDRDVDAAMPGDDDHHGITIRGEQPRQHREPLLARRPPARKIQIEHHDIDRSFGERCPGSIRIGDANQVHAMPFGEEPGGFADVGIVIDEQDGG